MAPVIKELDKLGDHAFIDSGQHYDYILDQVFYEVMDLRQPDYRFDLRGSTPITQVTETMTNCAKVFDRDTRLVVVVGDPNTPLGAALAANKMGIPIAHVEAGFRSFDRRMPEEHNRVLIDHLSDLLFAPSHRAVTNLRNEGIHEGVHMVGNPITDALMSILPKTQPIEAERPYAVVTMHRVENMVPRTVAGVFEALDELSKELTIVFPAHPRLRKFVQDNEIPTHDIKLQHPVDYIEMLSLVKSASVVLTDSGGLQEETCFLHVPCVTLRLSTERPETLAVGANRLALKPDEIVQATRVALASSRGWRYPYGDGTAAKQIARIIGERL